MDKMIKSPAFWAGVAAFLVGAGTGFAGLNEQSAALGIAGSVMMALGAGVSAAIAAYIKGDGNGNQ